MNETYKNPGVLEDGKSYRVWSLTGQGFLKLTTKNGGQSVEYSVTTEEESSKITARDMGFRLEFQEGGKKYALDANTVNDIVSAKSLPGSERSAGFYVKPFGSETQRKGSPLKALMALGPDNVEKCVASSDSEKNLSLKTFDKDIPHPDTIFLITEV